MCPSCGEDTKVIDSRQSKTEISFRRRRECLSCKERFSTVEEVVPEKRSARAIEVERLIKELANHLVEEASLKKITGKPKRKAKVDTNQSELERLIQDQAKDARTTQIQYGTSLDKPMKWNNQHD